MRFPTDILLGKTPIEDTGSALDAGETGRGGSYGRFNAERNIREYDRSVPPRRGLSEGEKSLTKGYSEYDLINTLRNIVQQDPKSLGARSFMRGLIIPEALRRNVNKGATDAESILKGIVTKTVSQEQGGRGISDYDQRMGAARFPQMTDSPDLFLRMLDRYGDQSANAISEILFKAQEGGVPRPEVSAGRSNKSLWDIQRRAFTSRGQDDPSTSPLPPDLTPAQRVVHEPILRDIKARMSDPEFVKRFKAQRGQTAQPKSVEDVLDFYKPKAFSGNDASPDALNAPQLEELHKELGEWDAWVTGVKQKAAGAADRQKKFLESGDE